jgi:hypothetical protein
MPQILVPVGLLASNPWIVLFFVFVALFCVMLYAREYFHKKFLPGRHGTMLFTVWSLASFAFLALLLLNLTFTLVVIFLDFLLIPVIIMAALPTKKDGAGFFVSKDSLIQVLLGAGVVIYILYVSISSTHGFGLVSGTGTGFEMRIVDSTGVPYKIMGASGINQYASKAMSSNGNWSVYLLFTGSGEIAYQDAILKSGATDNPDGHPLSLVVNNETIVSRPLTREYAAIVKTQRMRAVTILIGPGAENKERADRIVSSLAQG